jgi:hypothetical protein
MPRNPPKFLTVDACTICGEPSNKHSKKKCERIQKAEQWADNPTFGAMCPECEKGSLDENGKCTRCLWDYQRSRGNQKNPRPKE